MRALWPVAFVLLAGCTAPATVDQMAQPAYVEFEQPAFSPIAAAPLQSQPLQFLDPQRDLDLEVEGLRATNLHFNASFMLNPFPEPEGRHDPAHGLQWILLHPDFAFEPECRPAPPEVRWHWFHARDGNLVGRSLPPGNYTLLLYADRATSLRLDLGPAGESSPVKLPTVAAPVGLSLVTAEPAKKTVSLHTEYEFEHTFPVNQSSLLLTHFMIVANAYSGDQTIRSTLQREGANACNFHEAERNGVQGAGSWTSALNATLPPGTYTWKGSFDARAAANARAHAYGYLLSFGTQ